MPSKSAIWTELAIHRLRAGIARNENRREIGKAIGTTKSAVIGMARRLGLSKPREMDFSDAKRRARLDRRNQLAKLRLLKKKEASMTKVPSRPALLWRPHLAAARKTAGGPVTIFDLTDDTCRWPLWNDKVRPGHQPIEDLTYCGHPISTGSAYCPKHRNIADGRRSR